MFFKFHIQNISDTIITSYQTRNSTQKKRNLDPQKIQKKKKTRFKFLHIKDSFFIFKKTFQTEPTSI